MYSLLTVFGVLAARDTEKSETSNPGNPGDREAQRRPPQTFRLACGAPVRLATQRLMAEGRKGGLGGYHCGPESALRTQGLGGFSGYARTGMDTSLLCRRQVQYRPKRLQATVQGCVRVKVLGSPQEMRLKNEDRMAVRPCCQGRTAYRRDTS